MVFKEFKELQVGDDAVCFVRQNNALEPLQGKVVELDALGVTFEAKDNTIFFCSKEEIGYTFFVLNEDGMAWSSYRGVPIMQEPDEHYFVEILGRKFRSRYQKDVKLLIDDVLAIMQVHTRNTK